MIQGYGKYRLIRAGAILVEKDYTNTITSEGKAAILTAAFRGIRPGANWFFGLLQWVPGQGTYPGEMANHPSWTETNCGRTVRASWSTDKTIENIPASEILTTSELIFQLNKTPILMEGPGQIDAIFITNKEAIGDETGILWSVAMVTIPAVVAGDILQVDYTIKISSSVYKQAKNTI